MVGAPNWSYRQWPYGHGRGPGPRGTSACCPAGEHGQWPYGHGHALLSSRSTSSYLSGELCSSRGFGWAWGLAAVAGDGAGGVGGGGPPAGLPPVAPPPGPPQQPIPIAAPGQGPLTLVGNQWMAAKKENETIKVGAFPTSGTFSLWRQDLQRRLIAASAFTDQAEVAWVAKAWANGASFDALATSDDRRFESLDFKLSNALIDCIKAVDHAKLLAQTIHS